MVEIALQSGGRCMVFDGRRELLARGKSKETDQRN